jgi:hypothetical protein
LEQFGFVCRKKYWIFSTLKHGVHFKILHCEIHIILQRAQFTHFEIDLSRNCIESFFGRSLNKEQKKHYNGWRRKGTIMSKRTRFIKQISSCGIRRLTWKSSLAVSKAAIVPSALFTVITIKKVCYRRSKFYWFINNIDILHDPSNMKFLMRTVAKEARK